MTPSQNFVYADVDGHIGYYAPGRIPVRASGDGSLPADGWTGAAEWTGWIPFEELPHTYDPPEHFIVTANHRPEPAAYPHLLGLEWPEPYRAQRIIDLLQQLTGARGPGPHKPTRKLTPDDFARIQSDTLSLHAQALLPLLLARVHPESAPDRQAVGLLRQWNFDAAADSAADGDLRSLVLSARADAGRRRPRSSRDGAVRRSASASSRASSSTRSRSTTAPGATTRPRRNRRRATMP